MAEICVMYPTDIAKTRAQLATSKGVSNSMWRLLSEVVRNEGPLALYRGMASPIFAEAPKRTLQAQDASGRLILCLGEKGI